MPPCCALSLSNPAREGRHVQACAHGSAQARAHAKKNTPLARGGERTRIVQGGVPEPPPPLKLSHFASVQTKSSELRAQFAIEENARVIVYMGSFFYFSGLDVVLRNLSEVKEKPHLLLIGGGEQEKELRKLVEKLKLTGHVTFCGFVSYEELPTMLRVADIAINPMRPSLVAHTALPNKVLQYMASGMPVVTTNLLGLASLFEQLPGLILVRDSSQVLESAISLANSPNLASSGERNRDEVSKKFDVEGNVLAFEKLLLDVVRVNG